MILAVVMKSDDIMMTAAVAADADSQAVQDHDSLKAGLFDANFYNTVQIVTADVVNTRPCEPAGTASPVCNIFKRLTVR